MDLSNTNKIGFFFQLELCRALDPVADGIVGVDLKLSAPAQYKQTESPARYLLILLKICNTSIHFCRNDIQPWY